MLKQERGGGAPTGAPAMIRASQKSSRRRREPSACGAEAGRRQVYAVCATRLHRARSPLGAPPRHSLRLSPRNSAPGRVSWDLVMSGVTRFSPVPVQRAPRRPVVMPDERNPRASRERGYEPRPQAPHSLRLSLRLRRRPSRARFVECVTEMVTNVKERVPVLETERLGYSFCRDCLPGSAHLCRITRVRRSPTASTLAIKKIQDTKIKNAKSMSG